MAGRAPRKRRAADPAEAVRDYRHDESKRLNNPPAGLTGQRPTMVAEGPPKVEYDPHKPPVLGGAYPATLRNWHRPGKLTTARNPMNRYRLYRREGIEAFLAGIQEHSQER